MTQQLTRNISASLPRMTYRQFLKLDGEDQRVEWVNGEVVGMAPVSGEHQDLGLALLTWMKAFVEAGDLGVVRYDPFQMKTGANLPGRAPDILFVSKRNVSRLKKNYMNGPADLVVEIISEGTRGVDRGEKFFEYEQGGVREYWLLDPIRKDAEFYQRGRDGHYKPAAIREDGIYRSNVLKGMWIRVDWLWRRPTLLAVLREWKLI